MLTRMPYFIFIMEPFLLFVATFHIIVCPFTKVEESFNVQATHDLLYHGFNLSNYDHFEFPGVVPRTFIGPLILAFASYPFFAVGYLVGWKKFTILYLARFMMGVLGLQALKQFLKSVHYRFGPSVVLWVQIITCTQFHYLFYITRPLPNIFALMLVSIAYYCWLLKYHRGLVITSSAAVVLFRGELCILLGIIILFEIWSQRIDLISVLRWGITSSLCMLVLTVAVDSLFWKRLLWPEGEVMWFNIVLNKSSEWGTMPFFWYFYNALPRSLLLAAVGVPFGYYFDKRTRPLVLVALLYVFLYSFLPHKELRFIIYVIPLFNVAAARAYNYLWTNRKKSGFLNILCFLSFVALLTNLAASFLMTLISSQTYPGGIALARLHELEFGNDDINVHFDSFAAQTGISRFIELNPKWRYNKTEGIDPRGVEMTHFTHLIVEHPGDDTSSWPYEQSHVWLEVIKGFYKANFSISAFPPLQLFDKPYLLILKRRSLFPTLVMEKNVIQTYQM